MTALSYTAMTVSYPLNAAITSNNPTPTGTATSYSVSPALPTGLNLDAITGIISGTPTVAVAAVNYIVTVSGPSSSTATATLSIATTGKCNMLGHLIENGQGYAWHSIAHFSIRTVMGIFKYTRCCLCQSNH